MAFAGGHFRMKQWGRTKIKYELKQKQVSEYCIRKAMNTINQGDYEKVLRGLVEKKHAALKGEQYLVRKKKTMDYLLQKGYEPQLVKEALERLTK